MNSFFYKYFPVIFFSLVWIGVFFFLSKNLFNIHSISSETIFVLICGITALILGYVIFSLFDRNFLPKRKDQNITLNVDLFANLITSLFLLNIVGSVLMMLAIGQSTGDGIMVYFQSPVAVRIEYISFITDPDSNPPLIFKLGSYTNNFAFISNLFGGILLTQKSNKRLFGLLPIFGAVVSSFATLGRFALLNSIGLLTLSFLIFSYFYSENQRKILLRQFFVYSTMVVSGLVVIFYSILSIRIVTGIDVQEYFLRTLYFYFTGGVAALDDFLKTDYMHLFGLSSFRSFFEWLGRFGIWPKEQLIYGFDEFTKVSPDMSINTYTFVKSLIYDFGMPGVLGISFLWGGAIKILLKKVYANFSFFGVYWACIFIFGSLMSFYAFYFQSLTLVIFWALSLGIILFFFGEKLILPSAKISFK